MSDKCIVKDCVNRKNEGNFIGDICAPCYTFITKNEGKHSQAYRNAVIVCFFDAFRHFYEKFVLNEKNTSNDR